MVKEECVEPDTAALTAPTDWGAVATFRRAEAPKRRWNDRTALATGAVIVIGSLLGGVPIIGIAIASVRDGFAAESLIIPLCILAAAAVVVGIVRVIAWRVWARRWRLTRFASDNGMTYEEAADEVEYPGSVFRIGGARESSFRSLDGPHTEFGEFAWVAMRGESRSVHRVGFAAFRLERPLPHMILDATANNGFLASLVYMFKLDRRQVVPLHPAAAEHFTLYAPVGYDRDARAVFTPELTATLVEVASGLDIEVIDDWLFVFSTTPFDVLDPETWTSLYRVKDVVAEGIREAAGRYRGSLEADPARASPRLEPPVREGSGRRLRGRLTWRW